MKTPAKPEGKDSPQPAAEPATSQAGAEPARPEAADPEPPPGDLPQPYLAPPFAFVCAGILASVGGYLYLAIPAYTELFQHMGLALPMITMQALRNPVAAPLACLALAGFVLAGGYRFAEGEQAAAKRRLATLGTVLCTGFCVLVGLSLSLALSSVQVSLTH